jgi:hypothetical protein
MAETDRRLVCHHAYILLYSADATPSGERAWGHTYLKLWTLALPPDRHALLTAVAQAQRTLGFTLVR